MWLQAPVPEILEPWTETLLRPAQVSELPPATLVYGQWFEEGRSQAHCQLLLSAPGWGQLLSLKLRPGFSPPATWLQTLMQSFRLWRLECRCPPQWVPSFRRWQGTPLPLEPEHWQIFWLAAETVLAPDFHWPQPPLHRLPLPDRLAQHYQLDVLRADQIHPLLSGNKWFKLSENLRQARRQGRALLASFGGAWSNHLFSLAAAGSLLGFKTLGLLRGEAPAAANPVLQCLQAWGMEIHWLERGLYRQRGEAHFLQELQARWPEALWIPEGGSNLAGVQGARGLLAGIAEPPELIVCALGTGATLAGLIQAAPAHCRLLGIPVLKGADFLQHEVQHWLQQLPSRPSLPSWELDLRWHGGGYARAQPELRAWIAQQAKALHLPLEPVYSGKCLYGLWQRMEAGDLPAVRRILWIHTGGIYPWNSPGVLDAKLEP